MRQVSNDIKDIVFYTPRNICCGYLLESPHRDRCALEKDDLGKLSTLPSYWLASHSVLL